MTVMNLSWKLYFIGNKHTKYSKDELTKTHTNEHTHTLQIRVLMHHTAKDCSRLGP